LQQQILKLEISALAHGCRLANRCVVSTRNPVIRRSNGAEANRRGDRGTCQNGGTGPIGIRAIPGTC
jgi:hypothetical protein